MALLQLVSNPAKRRGRKKKTSSKKRRTAKRSVARRSSRKSLKLRSNPIRLGGSGFVSRAVNQQLVPAAKQAAGALAVDVAFGYAGSFIPAQFTTGALRHVTKAVGAIALSAVAANFIKGSTANEMAKGALTVVLHDAAKELMAASMPGIPLGFFSSGYVATPMARLGGFRRRSLGMLQPSNVMDFSAASSRRVGI